MIKLIYASDLNNGIGKNNSLPWNHSEDLKKFKELTENNIIVMGKNTWKSLPCKLPNRMNVVIGNLHASDCEHKPDKIVKGGDVISEILMLDSDFKDKDVWVIGGKYLYESVLSHVDEIHHTVINDYYDCDIFFNHKEFIDTSVIYEESLSKLCTYIVEVKKGFSDIC